MSKSIYVACPDCATLVTLTKKTWVGWTEATCPKCNRPITPDEVRNSIAYCPKCNRDIAYNGLLGPLDKCPTCSSALQLPQTKIPPRTVICPFCRSSSEIAGDYVGDIQCEHCKKTFSLSASERTSASFDPSKPVVPRISSDGMSPDHVLWRYPAEHIAPASTIELQPGTVALLVSGDRCMGIQSESGPLMDVGTPVRIVFARQQLSLSLLWGIGSLHLHDSNYRFNGAAQSRGYMSLRVNDFAAFARRLQYRDCTEQQIGLNDPFRSLSPCPKINIDQVNNIPAQRIMEQSYQRVIDERGCTLLNLTDYQEDVCQYFHAFANNLLMREWGLEVTQCIILEYPIIKRAALEIVRDVKTALTMPLSWRTTPHIQVHLMNRPKYTSTLEVSGLLQLSIVDEKRLYNNPDMIRWNSYSDRNQPAREVSTFLSKQLYAVLQMAFQDHMNLHEGMLTSMLPVYLYRIQEDMKEVMNSDLPYLMDRGLQISTLTMELNVIGENELMRTWNALQNERDLTQMQNEMDDIHSDARIRNAERNDREQLRIYLSRLNAAEAKAQADEEIARTRHQRDVNDMIRAAELTEVHSDLQHRQAVRDQEQTAALDDMKNAAQTARQNHAISMNRTAAEARRTEEISARRHDLNLTGISVDIERTRLDLQADKDDYNRRNAVLNEQARADITRTAAQGKADAEVAAGEARLHLSAEAQHLSQQAARAAQDLVLEKADIEFDRSMSQIRMEMDLRSMELDADLKRQALQADIERLRLSLNHLTQRFAQEASAAQANAQLEANHLRTRMDYELKMREQDNRLALGREQLQQKRSEQSKADAQQAENLMAELRRLQRECTARSTGSTEYSAMQHQLSDLQHSVETIVKNLSASLNGGTLPTEQPAAPFGVFGEVNRPASPFDYDSTNKFNHNTPESAPAASPVRQPGMTSRSNACPSCGYPTSSFSYKCMYCGAKLK